LIYFNANTILENEVHVLGFSNFEYFVYKHELDKHLEYLKVISDVFNDIDLNHDGVLTRKQFLKLLEVFGTKGVRCDF